MQNYGPSGWESPCIQGSCFLGIDIGPSKIAFDPYHQCANTKMPFASFPLILAPILPTYNFYNKMESRFSCVKQIATQQNHDLHIARMGVVVCTTAFLYGNSKGESFSSICSSSNLFQLNSLANFRQCLGWTR